MSEYISREDINRVLQERNGANKSCLSRAREKGLHATEIYFQNLVFEDEQIASLIEELPSADVRPNIHGHWELNERGIWNCPKCGTEVYDGDCDKFCRVCGADFKYTPHEQMMIEPKGEKGTE